MELLKQLLKEDHNVYDQSIEELQSNADAWVEKGYDKAVVQAAAEVFHELKGGGDQNALELVEQIANEYELDTDDLRNVVEYHIGHELRYRPGGVGVEMGGKNLGLSTL